jgi:uncharacterized protein involved in exopolysaccharide biosynthesis
MIRNRAALTLWLGLALVAIIVHFRVSAQERPREEPIAALLVEVRGLRGAIEQLAAVGARVQLTTSRLQLQEQRVNTLIARLAQQRDRMPPVERELADLQRRAAGLESVLATETEAHNRQNSTFELKEVRAVLAQHTTELRRLQSEEAEVANLLATEQARWSDLNRQLEDLDRVLRRQ